MVVDSSAAVAARRRLMPLGDALLGAPRRALSSFVEVYRALWLAPRILRFVREQLILCLVATYLEAERGDALAFSTDSVAVAHPCVHVSRPAEGKGVTTESADEATAA